MPGLEQINEVELNSYTEQAKRSASHLLSQIWNKPVYDSIIYQRTKNYWMNFFLAGRHGTESGPDLVYNWVEQGKFYGKKFVHATEAVTAPSAGQLLIPMQHDTPYFAPKDIVDIGIQKPNSPGVNIQATVLEVSMNNTTNTRQMKVRVSSDVAALVNAAMIVADVQIALTSNAQGECFEKMPGKLHLPEKHDNCLQVINNSMEMCDQAVRQRLWFKMAGSSGIGYLDYEDVKARQAHNRDVDNALIFGQKDKYVGADGYDVYKTEGMVPKMSKESPIFQYSGTLLETDLEDMLNVFSTLSKFKEWDCFGGQFFCTAIQRAFKHYAINGSFSYGSFSGKQVQKFGMNVTSYRWGNLKLNLFNYDQLDDPDFLPQNAGAVSYRDMGILLSAEAGTCKVRYQKTRKGQTLKAHYDEYSGLTMAGNHKPTLKKACIERTWTTVCGMKQKGMNNHALMMKA